MGQTFSLATLSAGSAGIDVPELSDLSYEKSLGTARFMKSIRARHQHGLVVVKLVMKPFPQLDLGQYVRAIRSEREALNDVPNALGYQRIFETSTNGYLVRQYFYSSLYDRMSTRPFLEDIEKKWLAYQLLCALRDCHARNIYHGDIKTENVLVTSWNWLYLTDFSSSFKKTYLPEDNPADFSYYFDTSGRRTCYLAPERFLGADEKDDGRGVTWAMDVFSVGCVIAELFLEAPIFSLSQLYKYRKGEYDPKFGYLGKIQDQEVRELVGHMIQLEPESRFSAEEYLKFWRRKAFPEYFYSFLHQYMGLITDPSSGRAPVLPKTANFGEADDRIDRVYYDFDKISYFLGYENEKAQTNAKSDSEASSEGLIPVQIDIPNNRHEATTVGRRPVDDGSLIFLTLVVSSLRNTARSTARVRACDLILAFAERITDEAKLDRVLPYLVAMLNDRADIVKVAAIRTMAQLLSMITVVSPVNAYVFTEYIRPRLQQFIVGGSNKASPIVRATYASCLASLAHTSSSILDMLQALRADGSVPTVDPEAEDGVDTNLTYQNSFDVARLDLLEHFEAHTKALLTDSDTSVRRAFLGSVSSLCVFFGSSKTNDVILSHLNTYLNDKDWILKCAFFQTIVGVATFVGGTSLEEFILPLMIQALTDPEEFVVEKVLSSFASMAELGLFQRSRTWEMVDIVARFMVHPNIWIREAAAHFVSSSTRYLSIADLHCIVSPLVQPYLKSSITDFSETSILDNLRRPLPRPILEMAVSWALKVEGGLFWKPVQQQRTFSFGSPEQALPTISSKDLRPNVLSKIAKNNEDEQWITRLRNIGMSTDDDFKLLALREYIWRIAHKQLKAGPDGTPSHLNSILLLKEMNVTPQTIFFENQKRKDKSRRRASNGEHQASGSKNNPEIAPHTIADALLDASATIDDPLSQRKKSYANARRERLNGTLQVQSIPIESRRSSSNVSSPLSTSPRGRRQSHPTNSTDNNDNPPSAGTLTPTDSLRTGGGHGRSGGIKHKSSAINLLNRRDTSKTVAETGTTSANAFGKVDGPFTREPSEASSHRKASHSDAKTDPKNATHAGHTYDGNDPSVLRFLDSLASENYPHDIHDFGPLIMPISSKRHLMKKADSPGSDKPWRPEGTLIATFAEHTGPINRVVPSPDHAFFITGSDDGTVKVWDTMRLERNLTHRSRQTHSHAEGAKVKCLCFVENTHSFVSGATDGSINVVKVDHTLVGDTSKYGRLRSVRDYQLPEGEHAVWLDHSKLDTQSVLLLATNTSRVVALDLRNMTVIYSFKNPVHHGTPTCFCVDHKHGWMLIGTSHGVLDLWDLRFRLRLKGWGLAGGTPIHRLIIHPFKTYGRCVCVTGGTGQTDITIWDVEKTECREVFRVGVPKNGGKENLKAYEPWKVDEEKPEGMLGRFATAIDPSGGGNSNPDRGFRALAVGIDSPEPTWEGKYGFFLTGGADKKLRFWDVTRADASTVISGLAADEDQPRFTTSHPTATLTINSERIPQVAPSAPNAAAGNKPGSSSAGAKKPSSLDVKPPRSTIISKHQQQLLRSHLDTILDVCLLESPVGMTVSVDRMGCIYVFQ
ncbi:hypothetical protein HO173_012448 [Letharia columbiana]|uniref:non-specific serine/threonine protein kinase n=1 Tax=Letharia columbiana TaxID=112416 RepID=A0A8H6CNC3_9LECA|nr:uncharacterized protein HO173_012448 [Letharia columbiana]KAF6226618.1 hypothetical protein HO173_012448 [Letharia columbiana]